MVDEDDRGWQDEAKDVVDELEEDMLEWWETMWGGTCFKEGDACSAISYCHIEDEIIGQ